MDAAPRPFSISSGDADWSTRLFLIIDAVADMRSALSMTLSSFGANKVDFAGRASDAIARIRQREYDVILCDYDLGHGYDGLNLLEEIKHHNLIKQSCVFMVVTGENRAKKVISAVELTPDDYLLKPFTGEELRRRLDRALKKKFEFRSVDSFILHHEYLAAIQECDRRIGNQDPYLLDFLKLKGRLQLTIGDHGSARNTYQQILDVKPLPWAQMGLAKALYHLGEYAPAKALFQQVLSDNGKVMEAYDWLARCQEAYNEAAAAQATLQQAVQLSPSIIHRQKALGKLAHRNMDLDVAEAAMQHTIDLARHSFWRDAADYAELTRVQLDKGDLPAARKTVTDVRRAWRGDPTVAVLSDVLDCQVSLQAGETERAAELLASARGKVAKLETPLPDAHAVELASTCFQLGEDEAGSQLVRKVLRHHNNDPTLLADVSNMFERVGKVALGQEIAASEELAIVELNNAAVRAAQAGDLDGAVRQFVRAVDTMPGNQQVILNAVNALLAHVSRHGWNQDYMRMAREYLNRARQIDPKNGKYQKMLASFKNAQLRFGVGN